MKSLVYHGPHDIRYEDVPDPRLSAAGSAVVEIGMCSICGSDLHPYHKDTRVPGFNGASDSYCIGHEAIGHVVEVGSEVSRFKVGDRVIIAGSLSCGNCRNCRAGLAMLCENHVWPQIMGQGIPGIGGCQAEGVEVPLADVNLVSLPGDMPDELGILLSDTMATAWLCARKANIPTGGSVAVIGLGAVGMQGVLAARAQRAGMVYAIDFVAERRALAEQFGAIPVDGENAAAVIAEATGGLGVDCVMDAVGGTRTADLAMQLVRRGGHVSIVGVPDPGLIPFPAHMALVRNIDISLMACSVQAQLPEVFAALASGALDRGALDRIVTHHMHLSEGPAAYELFDQRRDGIQKVVLTR